MMTKKDYIAIAMALANVPKTARQRAVNALCPVFKADNPRFDEARFRAAANTTK
jgi:hypothetical protein